MVKGVSDPARFTGVGGPSGAKHRSSCPQPVAADQLAGYGRRKQTRTDHLRAVMTHPGWRTAEELPLKELDEFLLAGRWSTTRPVCCSGWRASIWSPGGWRVRRRVAL